MADSAAPPRKPCHNCRRQRLRCDRSYPHCNKCVVAGKECLGYGQLFRWTGAVASRGRLAGKTFIPDDAPTTPAATTITSNSTPPPPSRHGPQNGTADGTLVASRPYAGPSAYTAGDDGQPQAAEVQLIQRLQPPAVDFSSPIILVDPLFQDMPHTYRYYLSYFTNRVCKDLVSHDLPDRNPFRRLLPLTRAHPLLQHIVVAASAAHMSNLVRPAATPQLLSNGQVFYPSCGEASDRAFRDALIAKHKALKLMNDAVRHVDTIGVDVVLAAALFFVNVELMESGKHGWKPHLEGAGRIMSLLGPDDSESRDLRDYILSDCSIYYVLASAFMPPTSSAKSYFESAQIPALLEKATANSYLCCPPDVLNAILTASRLSNVKIEDEETATRVAEEGMELLRRARNFDMRAWAEDALKVPYLHEISLQSRINAGSAHRMAACLYIVQAIPAVGDKVGTDVAIALENDLFEQLSVIPEADTNFKATVWPTFIAGVGAMDSERRQWVMERLKKLVVWTPWGFIYTAMETLQIIWNLDSGDKRNRSWVQILKDPEMNLLIV